MAMKARASDGLERALLADAGGAPRGVTGTGSAVSTHNAGSSGERDAEPLTVGVGLADLPPPPRATALDRAARSVLRAALFTAGRPCGAQHSSAAVKAVVWLSVGGLVVLFVLFNVDIESAAAASSTCLGSSQIIEAANAAGQVFTVLVNVAVARWDDERSLRVLRRCDGVRGADSVVILVLCAMVAAVTGVCILTVVTGGDIMFVASIPALVVATSAQVVAISPTISTWRRAYAALQQLAHSASSCRTTSDVREVLVGGLQMSQRFVEEMNSGAMHLCVLSWSATTLASIGEFFLFLRAKRDPQCTFATVRTADDFSVALNVTISLGGLAILGYLLWPMASVVDRQRMMAAEIVKRVPLSVARDAAFGCLLAEAESTLRAGSMGVQVLGFTVSRARLLKLLVSAVPTLYVVFGFVYAGKANG